MAELVWLVRNLFAKVLRNYQVLNSLLALCFVFRTKIRTGWRLLDGFSFSWNSPGRRSLWLRTATTSSTSWRIPQFWLHRFGTERFGTGWNCLKPFAMFGREESVVEESYQVLNSLVELWIVISARIRTGLRWLDGFSFSWNSPGRSSLWWGQLKHLQLAGIPQFWLHGFGTVRLGLVGIVCNVWLWGVCGRGLLYHELNWLEDMPVLTENIKG